MLLLFLVVVSVLCFGCYTKFVVVSFVLSFISVLLLFVCCCWRCVLVLCLSENTSFIKLWGQNKNKILNTCYLGIFFGCFWFICLCLYCCCIHFFSSSLLIVFHLVSSRCVWFYMFCFCFSYISLCFCSVLVFVCFCFWSYCNIFSKIVGYVVNINIAKQL